MNLTERTNDIVDQLTRYGGEVASEELAAVLWQLTCVNDDMHHGRDLAVVLDSIREAARLLDQLMAPIAAMQSAISELHSLRQEDRLEVFAQFCTHCGRDDPACQCWNNE